MLKNLSPAALAITVFALWRLTHLFWGEDGPAHVFVRLRRAAGSGFWGALLDCFYCLSLWIAAPLAWIEAENWLDRLILWFGLSGAAILLQNATARFDPQPPPALWRQEPLPDKASEENNNYVVLR